MCLGCVCNLMCKLISLAISLIFIVAVILLILWAANVIFVGSDNDSNGSSTRMLEHASQNISKLIQQEIGAK